MKKTLAIITLIICILLVTVLLLKKNEMKVATGTPTDSEKAAMEKDSELCFEDSDCYVEGEKYTDCNGPWANRYYCEKNECSMTLVLCPHNEIRVCIQNKCSTKRK